MNTTTYAWKHATSKIIRFGCVILRSSMYVGVPGHIPSLQVTIMLLKILFIYFGEIFFLCVLKA